jgi:hypothetical protein
MTDFYALEGTSEEHRAKHLSVLLAQLKGDFAKDQPTWFGVRDALLAWKARLIRALMDAKIRLSA